MGKTGKEIVKANVDEAISDLLKAYADEWLAHYQYWVAAMWLKGVDADTFRPILLEMSQHELKHAEKLARRIIQLGGKPVLDFSKLLSTSGCGYIPPPEDPTDYLKLIKDVLKAEACAIKFYSQMVEKYRTTDVVTHEVFEELLEDEVEDEQTWEDLQAKL
ncbi:MAG: ferritin-like domain-containing protein [Candidatus Caldarchaeum sp.]|uniref:DNA protection during starvation protein n=1 Tax=Caldiarchaeum subterraneum TaxID=311458 RepID=A0A7C5Q8R3_CALS0